MEDTNYALETALQQGRDASKSGGEAHNPYDRQREPKLWAQYQRGFAAGRKAHRALKARRDLYKR